MSDFLVISNFPNGKSVFLISLVNTDVTMHTQVLLVYEKNNTFSIIWPCMLYLAGTYSRENKVIKSNN